MPNPRTMLSIPLLAAAAGLSACALQKNPSATVLRSEDFIADPTAAPTAQAPAPAETPDDTDFFVAQDEPPFSLALDQAPPPAPPITSTAVAPPPLPRPHALSAHDDAYDLAAIPGEPILSGPTPAPAASPILIDAKLGELNGRPVRVQELMDELGPRLATKARERRFTREEWEFLRLAPQTRAITRDEWLLFARASFTSKLEGLLEDELLQAEARASLRPEQQQGLRYMVQEFGQQERRRHGGSQAELSRSLREGAEPKTEQQLRREREAAILIGYQIDERIRKRIRVSWKDVRLFYERNFEAFNPPATATFRMIQVPASDPEALDRVETALRAGAPFEEVARSLDNRHDRENAGFWGALQFSGDYAQATLFNEPLNSAARALTPGAWAGPLDFAGTKAFLFLEKVDQRSRPLSNPHVQLALANALNQQAFDHERRKYIGRLKDRASYSPIDEMAARLTQIAASRFWPQD
jgi:hypothetical protein